MNKAIVKVFAVLFLLCCLLCSCSLNHTSITANYSVAYFAYPIDMTSDGHSISAKTLETDAYGRTLLQFHADSLTNREISDDVFVIMQKYTKKAVYFYEDIGWNYAGIDEENLQQWKEQNDWDQPLQESKMSCRNCHVTFDGHTQRDGDKIPYEAIKKYFLNYEWDKEFSKINNYRFVDCDEDGKELWIVQFESENGATEAKYIIATKGEGISAETLPVSEALADRSKLTRFKYENGWSYPNALIDGLLKQ